MLSIQAVRGLPCLRAPGIVPCIISFLFPSWCDTTSTGVIRHDGASVRDTRAVLLQPSLMGGYNDTVGGRIKRLRRTRVHGFTKHPIPFRLLSAVHRRRAAAYVFAQIGSRLAANYRQGRMGHIVR